MERIETDILNNFKILGVPAEPLNGSGTIEDPAPDTESGRAGGYPVRLWGYGFIAGSLHKDYGGAYQFCVQGRKDVPDGKYHRRSFVPCRSWRRNLPIRGWRSFWTWIKNLIVNLLCSLWNQVKAIKLVKGK